MPRLAHPDEAEPLARGQRSFHPIQGHRVERAERGLAVSVYRLRIGEQDPDGIPGLGHPARDQAEVLVNLLDNRPLHVDRPDHAHDLPHQLRENGCEHVPLRLEVVVEGPSRNAGRGEDVGDTRPVVPPLREDLPRCGQQTGSALGR